MKILNKGTSRMRLALACCLVVAISLFAAAPAAQAACPNEAIREAQGTTRLPGCMALEMVSPPKKLQQEAYSVEAFSSDGNRVLFRSKAILAGTEGQQSVAGDLYVAERTSAGWKTTATSPPASFRFVEGTQEHGGAYQFGPALDQWVLFDATEAEAMIGEGQFFRGQLEGALSPLSPFLAAIYNPGATDTPMSILDANIDTPGSSADLSATVFTPGKNFKGATFLPGDPQLLEESQGDPNSYVAFLGPDGQPQVELLARDKDGVVYGGACGSHLGKSVNSLSQGAISPDGSRIFFSARPAEAEGSVCSVNQTAKATTSTGSTQLSQVTTVTGTGTLATGTDTIGAVVVPGSTSVFQKGQSINGTGIPAGTTITGVGIGTLTISANATASGTQNLSAGPQPFAAGQRISGPGIPAGATITAVNGQTLTLSAPATASAAGVIVTTGGSPLRIFQRDETPTGPQITEIAPGGPAVGSDRYEGASADADLVYFTSPRKLTPADNDTSSEPCSPNPGSSAGCDLYRYDAAKPPGERLTLISAGGPGDPTPGQAADVLSGVTAISTDGSHVYFVAQGILCGENVAHESPVAGAPNLYLYEQDAAYPAGRTVFVATLASADNGRAWNLTGNFFSGTLAVPQLAPDGIDEGGDGHILFVDSQAPLTADDTDGGFSDLFRYDAVNGAIERISVAAPGGSEFPPANVNVHTPTSSAAFSTEGRFASEDGETVAFETSAPLVANAVAGENADYVWRDGHLAKLAGLGQFGSPIVSPDGSEVGFDTPESLLPQDGDTAYDIYTARVGGGFPIQPEPAVCDPLEEGNCQGSPGRQPDQAIATDRPIGTGNVTEPPKCKRGLVHRHGRCVKPHHKRKHSSRHHKRRNRGNSK
jgi:hypothetical protein